MRILKETEFKKVKVLGSGAFGTVYKVSRPVCAGPRSPAVLSASLRVWEIPAFFPRCGEESFRVTVTHSGAAKPVHRHIRFVDDSVSS